MSIQLRAPWHDYHSKCIYMVTLLKNPGTPDFGCLGGDCKLRAEMQGSSFVCASMTGDSIKATLRKISGIEPNMRLLQYALMPDHLNMLLSADEPTEASLGENIARFKAEVNHEAGYFVFEQGFNDQILTKSRSLDVLFSYLRDNPRGLAVRREYPEYFRRVNRIVIGGRECRAYGNLLLLRNPFKEQVVVHRADTAVIRKEKRERWLYTAANRGVLVSPFISREEKEIRALAEEAGGKLIVITNRTFGERYKPHEHDFALCEDGRLCMVSLPSQEENLSRAACMEMNGLAKEITNN